MPLQKHNVGQEEGSIIDCCRRKLDVLLRETSATGEAWEPEDRLSSVLRGAVMTIQFFPHTKIRITAPVEDSTAIENDWSNVGADLYAALIAYSNGEDSHGVNSRSESPGG